MKLFYLKAKQIHKGEKKKSSILITQTNEEKILDME
jgi:hypothetical protein